jgi:hypothetical protein
VFVVHPPASPPAGDAGGERALFSPGDRVRWRYSRDYEPTVTIINCPLPPRTDADVRHEDGRKLIADTRDLTPVASPPPAAPGPVELVIAAARRASHRGYLRDDGQNALQALADELSKGGKP